TPIASIRLYLQTLQRREVAESQRREFYQSMLLDTDRLMHTVEQVLKAGAVGQKRAASQELPLELDNLVRECMDVARARHHLQPEALEYHESPTATGTASVTGDLEELRTAISNLLDNAVKYSPNGVHISVQVAVPDDNRVVLSVSDNGVGIPQH